jgi:5-methylcytosine-specific restriction endonuclease McrA
MRKVNNKCKECALTKNFKNNIVKPSCYSMLTCPKKICYYRKHDYYKQKLRQYHRYLKFLGTKCLVCGSTQSLEVHHIHSQSSGGTDCPSNLITLCYKCHKIVTTYLRRVGME